MIVQEEVVGCLEAERETAGRTGGVVAQPLPLELPVCQMQCHRAFLWIVVHQNGEEVL